ncbi:hypothetical protein BEL04_21545 [Mucilaginibacter sp. PPCGB 2223]|uniref:hypothetical protein n=1 Tax=Mucilaginibacter sp. PPCGB 2223 TaxID=1886027 RepID=UPI000824233C|nr:hypothetical protein [Mucilaginibacter sp. PPCGB 2223]OCX50372.1 hypothetical protein BEL04_21545 [Mucilaginibacter sp. PPCGB 2223]
MKTRLFIAALVSILATACSSEHTKKPGCGDIICTHIFVSIPVKIITTDGSEVKFKSYKVVNLATGRTVNSNPLPGTANPNTIVIADDSHLKQFAEKGENLQLQIKKTNDSILKVNYKISGGKCACHVSKLDGPDEVNISPQ